MGNDKCHAKEPARGCESPVIDEYDLFPEVTDFRNRLPGKSVLAHTNINSFRHKIAFVSDILQKRRVDYLAISETKPVSPNHNLVSGIVFSIDKI